MFINEDSKKINEECKKYFMERTKKLRIDRGLTKRTVAEGTNISYSQVCKLESGQRTPDTSTIKSYAEFYGVSADYLLGISDDVSPLYAIACFSDISSADVERLSPEAQEDISKFIKYIISKENSKSNNDK